MGQSNKRRKILQEKKQKYSLLHTKNTRRNNIPIHKIQTLHEQKILLKILILFTLTLISSPLCLAYITDVTPDSTACSGTWDGSYPCANAYDNNWSSGACSTSGNTGYYHFNYTKPTNITLNTLLEEEIVVADGRNNLTIPFNCFQQQPLQFQIIVNYLNPDTFVNITCYDGSNWITIRQKTNSFCYTEETIHWDDTTNLYFHVTSEDTNNQINWFTLNIRNNSNCGSPPCSYNQYNTTNGTITLSLPTGQTYDFSTDIINHTTYFSTETFNDQNITNNTFIIQQTPLSLPIILNNTLPTQLVTQNLTMNCALNTTAYTLPSTNTYTQNLTNTDDTTQVYTQTGQTTIYTINNTDYQDNFNHTCTICNNYTCYTNEESTNYTIDKLIYFTTRNWVGTLLSNIRYYFNNTQTSETGNPLTQYLSTFINKSTNWQTFNINITDLTSYNLPQQNTTNITLEQTYYNYTLDTNDLTLTFSGSTNGYVADLDKRMDFTNSTLIVVQQNLSEGRVNVRFGLTAWRNNTQFYEFNNDFTTTVSDTLQLLDCSIISCRTLSGYFRAMDYSGSPLKDVIVRARFTPNSTVNTWTDHSLMGQRLTDNEGYTQFYFQDGSEIELTFSKDGYTSIDLLLTLGNDDWSKSEAVTVYMEESNTGSDQNAWLYIQRSFTNRSLDLTGVITAPNRDLVEVTTTYRTSQGLGREVLTESTLDRYSFTLESNTDYSFTTTDDITLQVYLDNSLWKTITISYDTNDKNSLFNFSSLTSTIFNPILFIALIMACVSIGLIFKNHNAGFITFMIGSALISIITTQFLYLSLICALYFGLKQVRKVISE